MAYTKQTWTDHVVDRPHTYTETVNQDGTKTLTAAGEVLQQGSPMSAERFNHIESGIEGAHTAVSNLETTTETALSGKVDKVTGKGLSTNDYTTAEKNKLAGLSNITVDDELSADSENPVQNKVINTALASKVSAVSGKGLSTNDYTTAEKNKLAGLFNITVDDELSSTSTNPVQNKVINSAIANKVDKVTGKGLSTNDYTTAEKNKLAGLSNYDDTAVNNAMVRADSPDEEGFSQLYKTVNGQRVNIDPKINGSAIPYTYMTVDEYLGITPETNVLYWVINNKGKHGVYKNSELVEGEDIVPHIYGVSWDGGPSTTWTRTNESAGFAEPVPALGGTGGSSPFDSCYPWSGMEEVTIDGNVLVKIPKFWYKITKNGSAMTFQIADRETADFYVSPAHADRGDGKGERDYVYIGKYKCNSSYKSVTGASPIVDITRVEARTGITNLGSGYYMKDYAMWWTVRMLYLVEMADWNSQTKIGYGCGYGSSVQNTGASDSMSYHTGTMQSSRTTYGVGVKYRGIEDLWGNVIEWIDGIYFSGANVYVLKTPSQYSDKSGGTRVGKNPPSGGYISAWNIPSVSGYEWALYPSAVSGSDTTYVTDYYSYYNYFAYNALATSGSYNHQNQANGLFAQVNTWSPESASDDVGVRLQYLP